MTAPPRRPVTPPEADLGPLPMAVGYLLRRAQLRVFASFNAAFAGEDIRPAQYSVLVVIARTPGVRAGDISTALAIKRTNLAPMLAELERRGLIARTTIPSDRRSQGLALTSRGIAFVGNLEARQAALEDDLRSAIGPERHAELLRLLAHLLDALGEEADDPTERAPAPKRGGRRKSRASDR